MLACNGKRVEDGQCASNRPVNCKMAQGSVLPMVEVVVEGNSAKALVDTGCSTTIVHSKYVDQCDGVTRIRTFDGSEVKCRGTRLIRLEVENKKLSVRVIVAD